MSKEIILGGHASYDRNGELTFTPKIISVLPLSEKEPSPKDLELEMMKSELRDYKRNKKD